MKNTPLIYGKAARFFHWATAILIAAMIPLGITMADMADGSTKSTLYLIHANLGFVVLILTALRILWKFIEPAPSSPSGLSPARQWLFNAIHLGQYVFLIGLTLTGSATFLATGPLAQNFPETMAAALLSALPGVHSVLSKGFIGLLLAHLTGLFQYQFTKGDVLTRMGLPKISLNL